MRIWPLCVMLLFVSCSRDEHRQTENNRGFTLMTSGQTGIDFSNDLSYTERINTYTYRNFYNGAGIALGDINNDGLLDIYISGNQVDSKLYLNKGDFNFEDITAIAGVAATSSWSTGVSMADVNGDGYIDLYVCKSGPPRLSGQPGESTRHNQLFINNGDLTFTDKAKQYQVADNGLSTHAAFFDYDKDGDLDMYLLNNSTRPIGAYDLKLGRRMERDPEGANKLYRNDGDYFTDVSEAAGIYGSAIGYGLGVTVGDVNKDGWQDIFISNDFFERDYLYLNDQNGAFSEVLEESMTEISMGSMGADMGDLNNDGLPEIYVTEMLPDSLSRIKTKTVFESWDKYQTNVKNGYHHQFTRNALQLNNGVNHRNKLTFSEISRITGLEATDWSWGALIFDYNNDTHKDIFVANGIFKDLMDHDYVNFYANNNLFISKYKADSTVLTNLIAKIPSTPLQNYLFKNHGDLQFSNEADALKLDHRGFSNGAVYG
ncbi:MAG: VCBS repeat-containing protein, partial [Cyclobacteriaceae bacterium]